MFFYFFGHEACGILAPQWGTESTPSALEGEVLTTTRLPGEAPKDKLFKSFECRTSHLTVFLNSVVDGQLKQREERLKMVNLALSISKYE